MHGNIPALFTFPLFRVLLNSHSSQPKALKLAKAFTFLYSKCRLVAIVELQRCRLGMLE